MITIVMDTSNQYLACGIYQDGQLIDSYQKIGTKRQSEDAIPVLYDLTNKHDIDLLKVDEMIITKGPGSYTGVRVAMTMAKTLAAICPVKIKTVSSLAVYGYEGKKIANQSKLEVKGKLLQEAVSVTLRQGDTYCKYSSSQFLLLLVGTSKESCKIVYRRILNKYKMLAGPRAEIEYSVVSLADLPEKLAEAQQCPFL